MDKSNDLPVLRAALESQLASLTRGRIVFVGPRDATRDGVPPEEPVSDSWYRPHNHRYVELMQVVRGRVRLALSTGPIRLAPGRTYFILPGVEHEEQAGDGRAYAVLVTSLAGNSSALWFLTERDPRGRVVQTPERVPDRLLYRSDEIGDLNRLARTREILHSARARALGQAILIRASAEAWERAGRGPADSGEHKRLVAKDLAAYLDQHYNQPLSLRDLADMMQCSENHLNSLFRHATGKTVHRYILERRMEEAHRLMRAEGRLVKQAAIQAGFKDALYFSRVFRLRYGVSPSSLRKSRPPIHCPGPAASPG